MRLFFLMVCGFVLLQAELTRVGDNTVVDSETKLEWQDNSEVSRISKKSWDKAIEYCEDLSLDGKKDWRLPNQNELLDIVDYTSSEFPINPIFNYTNAEPYWSSTTFLGELTKAWYVDFSFGEALNNHKQTEYFVRCVRAGK